MGQLENGMEEMGVVCEGVRSETKWPHCLVLIIQLAGENIKYVEKRNKEGEIQKGLIERGLDFKHDDLCVSVFVKMWSWFPNKKSILRRFER